MYHIIQIKDRKYIYFPLSQIYFAYTKELESELKKEKSADKKLQAVLRREEKMAEVVSEILKNDNTVQHKIGGCEINSIYGCNMKCRYCFASGGNHGKSGKMSKETVKQVLNFILKHSSKSKIEVLIVGGEPFLDFSGFKEIVTYGKTQALLNKKAIYFSTVSNGMNIDENISDFLKKEDIVLSVSLDSKEKKVNDYLRPTRNGKSSYEYIADNFRLFEGDTGLNVNVTITPYNLCVSEMAVFLFDKLNAKSIHFSEVVSDEEDMLFTEKDVDKLIEEYDELAELLIDKYKKGEFVECYPLTTFLDKIHNKLPMVRPCSVLKNKCAFSPEGKIYPCDMLMYDKYSIGDIENGFDYERINKLRKIYQDDTMCQDCWARYLCGGECLSTKMWGNIKQRQLRCKIKRHICKLKLYIYEKIITEIGNIEEIIGGH